MTVIGPDQSAAPRVPFAQYMIATAIDRAFVEPACVLFASIVANAAVPEAALVVFGLGLTSSDRDYLAKSCGKMADKLSVVDLDFAAKRLKKLPVTLAVPSVTAYARVIVPSLLPRAAARLLYLDSDIVVTGSLTALFETNLAGAVLAAVPDHIPPGIDHSFRSEVLKLPDPEFYFNSGVLLIDVEAWQKNAITEMAFNFYESVPASTKLWYPDQDILNSILCHRWLPLDRRWNYFRGVEDVDLQRFRSEATIVHFASGKKPWVSGSTHPARQIYLDHRKLTPFADKSLDSAAKYRLNQFLRSPISTVKNLSARLLRS
jgi:lipopolysaccharide biosynthesis glycosyltransferase